MTDLNHKLQALTERIRKEITSKAKLARISHQGDTGLKFQAPMGSNTARMV